MPRTLCEGELGASLYTGAMFTSLSSFRQSRWLLVMISAVCAATLGACVSKQHAGEQARATAAQYVFVILKTGPKSAEKSAAERQAIFQGHMANIQRLAAEKKLIIAGPFAKPADPTSRGIFLMDVTSVEEARALVATDPGVIEGVFTPELRPMTGSPDLRRTLALEDELQATLKQPRAAGEPPQAMRAYVIVIAQNPSLARTAIKEAGLGVVWSGEFYDKAGGGVFVVDSLDVAAVRASLPADKTGPCSIDGWFSTTSLMGLTKPS